MPTTETKKEVRICFDRIVPENIIARHRHPNTGMRTAVDVSKLKPSVPSAKRMAVLREKKWNCDVLDCRFLDGDAGMHSRVTEIASQWSNYCGIDLRFENRSDSPIRISFYSSPGSWSAVGTDALIEEYFPPHEPTMNFGWLREHTEPDEWSRIVLHEFGHALGCIHEHSAPNFDRQWDVDAVLEYFRGDPNHWSDDQIRRNVLEKYSSSGVQSTRFDPHSIMLYTFDDILFSDGLGPTNNNTELSAQDKQFISQVYPKG